MHHLSVTTDLMILVHLELMALTSGRRRSSGLKVYYPLRTNDTTSDANSKNNMLSLALFFKTDH